MNNNQEQQNLQNQGGSGSAENIGQTRPDQQHNMQELSGQQKNEIAGDIESGKVPVASLKDLGSLSGRDDAAGGSGDGMENTSTGEPTEK